MRSGHHVRATSFELIDDGDPEGRTFFGVCTCADLIEQDQ